MKKPWILCNNFLAAIEVKDIETVTHIVDSGFDVDTLLIDGKSAVSICIEKGATEIVQLLIKRGCSLSLKSPRGEYPLHLAVRRYDANLVQILLSNRADVTSIDSLGRTALHLACELNSLDAAKVLIDKTPKLHLNIADTDGRTPLMYACKYGDKDLVEYLLQKGCTVNVTDMHQDTPLLHCINNENCSSEMVSCLLNAGANVMHKNNYNESALLRTLHNSILHGVCKKNIILQEISELLIDQGSDLKVKNMLGQSLLHLAVSGNNEDLVKKLLNSGCDVDARDGMHFVPLFYACRNSNKRILDLLIKSGADLKAHNWIVLKFDITMSSSLALLDYLIQKTKEIQSLSALCRTVIRKSFTRSIEKYAKFLPLPTSLIKYIQYDELS